MKPNPRKALFRRDTRGAVLAEFVVAFVPLLTAFFAFVQLSKVATARLVVKHGAIIGARAAAVITNGNDNTPGQAAGKNDGEIKAAVEAGLGPWKSTMQSVTVDVADASSKADPYGWVTVTVTATYKCTAPMGAIGCLGSTKVLRESYRMPHQGANYK
ncbi:MAG: hypothetical protein KF764_15130 [Labilithrix sp.]|nr:hypothetical protein [Labilithrix sp.]